MKLAQPEALRDVIDELATESAPKHYAASVPARESIPSQVDWRAVLKFDFSAFG